MMRAVQNSLFAILAVAIVFPTTAQAAPPPTDTHELIWLVHEDLITGARPLSFYEALVAQASADATALVKGGQGPVDVPCCMAITDVSVATFTDSGSGFDLFEIDSAGELAALNAIGGSGARAFIVNALNFCSGPGSPIGCADTPTCGFEPSSQKLIMSMEAYDLFDSFGSTLAHERGHNSCLNHVSSNSCELMSASSGGGCLSASECAEFTEDAQTTSGTCTCYDDATTYASNASMCSEVPSGVCSGGLCGDPSGDYGVRLFGAAGTSAVIGDPSNDPIQLAGAPGDWVDLGEFTGSQVISGTAYSPGRTTLYGVGVSAGSDTLFEIDPDTGASTSLGSITGIDSGDDLVALAWNPGPTAATTDDALFALDYDGANFNSLYSIDPDTQVATKLGNLGIGGGESFTGLAYDPTNNRLYASAAFGGMGITNPTGLYVIATSCGGFCNATEVVDADLPGQTNKFSSALAYSAESGSIHHIGYQAGPRVEYDSYQATALASNEIVKSTGTRGLDGFTAGGLAALPAPIDTRPVPALPLAGGFVLGAALLLAPGALRRLRGRSD